MHFVKIISTLPAAYFFGIDFFILPHPGSIIFPKTLTAPPKQPS
jgi:hypothetical protein